MSIDIYLFLVSLSCALPVPFAFEGMNCVLRVEGWHCEVEPAKCISRGKVIFKKNCLLSCPEWVHYYYNDTHTCYTECPEDSVVDRYSCLRPATCTSKNQVVFNRSCVDACPVRSRYTKDGVCYSTCPKDNVINGSKCVDAEECTGMGHYVFNGTCVKSCPNQTPYIKYGTCLYTCSSDTVRNGNSSCITEEDCRKLHKVNYNGDCLESCPSKAPFNASGKCSTDCPKPYVKNGLDCIDPWDCWETKFVFDDKCISACPDEAPYHLFIDDIDQHTCLRTCQPDFVSYELKCIPTSSCMRNRVMYNGSCVKNCPNDAPFMHEKTCYSKCPVDLVANGSECISTFSCTSIGNKVIYNMSCVKTCPADAQFMHEKKCYSKCPDDLVANAKNCVTKHECVYVNGKFLLDGTCAESCPHDIRFTKDGECYEHCPDGSVSENTQCIENQKCRSKNNMIFNGACIEKCPSESPYENGGKCLVKCPGKRFGESDYMVANNGTQCIDSMTCTRDYDHYVYDQVCVPKCPTGTGVWLGERPPWDQVCYSLENTKIFSVLSSAGSVLCLLVLVSMVYNPKSSDNEKERGQQVKENEDPPVALDIFVVENEGGTGHLREHNPEENEDQAEPDFSPQPEVVAADGRNVIVHNDRSRFGNEVPLLTMANKGARNLNGDEDDDTLSTSL